MFSSLCIIWYTLIYWAWDACCNTVLCLTSRAGDNKPAAPPRPPPPSNRISVPQAFPVAPVAPLRPKRSMKPKNRKNVIEWFQQEELAKRSCYDGDKILPYFHGENTKCCFLTLKHRHAICTRYVYVCNLQHFPVVDSLILQKYSSVREFMAIVSRLPDTIVWIMFTLLWSVLYKIYKITADGCYSDV